MINLGDVNFHLGADTRPLDASVRTLRQFGSIVNQNQTSVERSASAVAAAYRRQEAAIVSAMQRTLNLNTTMRKVKGGEEFANRTNAALRELTTYLAAGERSTLSFQRAMTRFRASVSGAQRDFKVFSAASQNAAGSGQGLAGVLRGLQSSAILIQGPLGGIATRISNIGGLFEKTGFAMAAFFAGVGAGSYVIYKFGNLILDAGKQLNQFESSLTATTGSLIMAQGRLATLIEIARNTGSYIGDVAPSFTKFSVAAESAGITSAKTAEMFRIMSAASTKLQLGGEQTQGVFRALEQIMSKGTVQAEELRGQLGDRLPGALQIAARAMGVTSAKLQDMMKKGQLLSTEFLPKFIEELRKSLNIDARPVKNYTASLNNMRTSWFQLRAELDRQLGVTSRIMKLYDKLTETLDYLRNNLELVKQIAILTGIAMASIAAPAIISAVFALTKAIAGAAKAMVFFNLVSSANPWVAAAVALGTAIALLYQFKDALTVTGEGFVTLGDYFRTGLKRMETNLGSTIDNMKVQWEASSNIIKTTTAEWPSILSEIWSNLVSDTYKAINNIMGFFYNVNDALPELLKGIPNALGSVMIDAINYLGTKMAELFTWLSQKIADFKNALFGIGDSTVGMAIGWLGDKVGGALGLGDLGTKLTQDAEGVKYKWLEVPNEYRKAWDDTSAHVSQLMARQQDILGETAKEWRAFKNEVMMGAYARQYGMYASQQWKHVPTVNTGVSKPKELADFNSGRGAEATAKQIKALQRKQEAIKSIEDAIRQAYESIDALGGPDAALNSLNEKFKRDKQVEKYAKALRKAGVDTEYIKEKTEELNRALERKDLLEKQREALLTFRDSLEGAFDTMGDALWAATEKGADALDILKKAAISAARDILKTWWQLAALNPLKNAILGTDNPTLGGSWWKGLGGILGGILGGGGGGGGDPWAGLRLDSSPTSRLAPSLSPMSSRSGSGKSVVEVVLSPDLIAQVLSQAADQSVKVTSGALAKYPKSRVFESGVSSAIVRAKKGGRLGT